MVYPSCSCLLLSVGMEEITRKCDVLSLSAKEGERVVLPKKLKKAKHVLVAKFLTKRALNVERWHIRFDRRGEQKRVFV